MSPTSRAPASTRVFIHFGFAATAVAVARWSRSQRRPAADATAPASDAAFSSLDAPQGSGRGEDDEFCMIDSLIKVGRRVHLSNGIGTSLRRVSNDSLNFQNEGVRASAQ